MTLWDAIKFTLVTFAACIAIFLFTWAAGCNSLALEWFGRGNQLMMDKAFLTKEADVQRESFENSKSYRDGMVQELQNMQFQYLQADAIHKKGLASIILNRAAGFPEDALPSDLRLFLSQLRQGTITP